MELELMDPKLIEIAKFINNLSDAIATFKRIFIDSNNGYDMLSKYIVKFLGK